MEELSSKQRPTPARIVLLLRKLEFKQASETKGSWWPYWDAWLSERSGPDVPARTPGDGKLKPLADAPGDYVKVRS